MSNIREKKAGKLETVGKQCVMKVLKHVIAVPVISQPHETAP